MIIKLTLCLQFFTTLNKNPGQKAGSGLWPVSPWPDPTRTQIADPLTRDPETRFHLWATVCVLANSASYPQWKEITCSLPAGECLVRLTAAVVCLLTAPRVRVFVITGIAWSYIFCVIHWTHLLSCRSRYRLKCVVFNVRENTRYLRVGVIFRLRHHHITSSHLRLIEWLDSRKPFTYNTLYTIMQ